MAINLHRTAFFDVARHQPFAGHLTAPQIANMEAILDACPPDLGVDETAYCPTATFHETARWMQPIKDLGRGKQELRAHLFRGRG